MRNDYKKNLVSVIVPNHGRDLTLLKASLPPWVEFIEVNRGMERSRQRNLGIQEAKGEFLLILDSDQSISPGLIEECLQYFKWGYASIYIPEIIVAKSWFGKLRAFEREFYTGTAVDVPRFVRKCVCPDFDEEQHGTEDSDWGNRIPGLRCISDRPLYHHDDIPFLEYCRKKAYYTKSMKRYKERNKNDKCTNLKYRLWTVFTENGKWKKLLRHPIGALGILFILAVRGIIYATNR